ncbi:MAG: hypothetical protein IKJ01_02745 [Lachnospiraceae bacterium]|nr:hypothetical protein [Lachnospiraceae bacterium]
MSQIMKAFMGIFMILFLMVSSVGMLGAFLQVLHAQDMHACMIDEMENSNYCKEVLEECFEIAEQSGYKLELILYQENYKAVSCTTKAELPQENVDIALAKVTLEFPFRIVFFQINDNYKISGYGR